MFRSKRIKPHRPDQNEITQLLQLAKRDLNTSRRNLDDAPDWAYSIGYNLILQAGRALMFFTGYRPRGGEQHSTGVEFLEERLGSTFEGQVKLFDQMRRKRHRVIYEASGLVSRKEAEQVIKFAEKFVAQITEMITGQSRLGI